MKCPELRANTVNVELPTHEEQEGFLALGLTTDDNGRPLHPWRCDIPDLPSTKGDLWKWGPNYTVDPIVLSQDNDGPVILLIQRGDCGQWALPGGFVDSGENPLEAARRELREETSLEITDGESTAHVCYQGPVHDRRSTMYAWPETTSILMHVPTAPVAAGDDAMTAQWVPLKDVRLLPGLYGSHGTLIDMAIRDNGTFHEQLEYFSNQVEFSQPTGGHMGYTRHIASLPTGRRVFIKRHDADKFTDETRAQHSKRYLHKEHHVYQQLSDTSPHTPDHIELTNDSTLLLEAYDPRDGWQWKAPLDITERRRYIHEVIEALRTIEPARYEPFVDVKPSYHTIIDEGWGAYPTARTRIIEKLHRSSVEGARALADSLDELYERTQHLPSPELTHFAHYDVRQSNIAWHPEHGVRIVDWSWADPAPKGVDTTSFLIDIHKAGYSIDEHMPDFNAEHALILIGFWLGHSIWPTPTHDQTVREHQISSAVAAFQLLNQ
ncbi:hypothetical protein B7Z00_02740 [Candidatus Saccharibacteria bacterium 32-50-10]|nr:MAG: hypothetical protein B7Z00_02740 [Candidatus Saccharibacteria bacterium 32-50-10]